MPFVYKLPSLQCCLTETQMKKDMETGQMTEQTLRLVGQGWTMTNDTDTIDYPYGKK